MKTLFSVLFFYFALCIAGIAVSSSLIMVYIGCMNYVVGHPLTLFSLSALKLGVFISFPMVVVFIPMFLVLSLVRHSKKNRVIGIITTIVLSVASWTVVMPLYMKYEKSLNGIERIEKQRLSPGFFRLAEGKLYYFTNVDSFNRAEGIIIDTSRNASDSDSFKVIDNETVNIPGSGEFSDILVKRSVELPKLLENSLMDLYFIFSAAKKAFNISYIAWLVFCSFALALIFVFTFANISEWRLISAFFILLSTGLVLKLNAVVYGINWYSNYIPFLSGINNRLNSLFSGFDFIENPMALVLNVTLVFIFIIVGIAGKLTKHTKPQADDEDDE